MSDRELTRLFHIEDRRIEETQGYPDPKVEDMWICEDETGQFWARMGTNLFRNRRDAVIALLEALYIQRDNLLEDIKALEQDVEAERTAWRRREGALCGWDIRRAKAGKRATEQG